MANTTKTQMPQRPAGVDTTRFDEISLTLHNLSEIVKLAAFAAEARRTLAAIDNALYFREEVQEMIRMGVSNSRQWSEMEDNTGDVLDYVARQLHQVNDDFNTNFQDLAPARRVIPEAGKIGGAA